MFELKLLSRRAIASALAKAERYRLLNEPGEAESICQDVLAVEPANQQALVMLVLSMTDQFGRKRSAGVKPAREVVEMLGDPYERAYYGGVVCERWGKAELRQGTPGGRGHDWLREAMSLYEAAIQVRPEDNDDAILRWNACARLLNREERCIGRPGAPGAPPIEDEDVPPR